MGSCLSCDKRPRTAVAEREQEGDNNSDGSNRSAIPYRYAPPEERSRKENALAAVSVCGMDIKYAPLELQRDKEVVMKACEQDGMALQYTTEMLQNDQEVVLVACSQNGNSLQYASERLQDNKDLVTKACSQDGHAIKYASLQLQNDKEVVLKACSRYGYAIKYASAELQNNKEIGLVACTKCGGAIEFASESLRADKEIVMAAVQSNPLSIKFALGGLNQDKDILVKAKLWDEDYPGRTTTSNNGENNDAATTRRPKIVLSTKFSLSAENSGHATKFTVALKKHPFIVSGDFLVYSPNAFNKGTCDPHWTDQSWPCRGTYDTCQKPSHLKTGVPKETDCCWRYSFRWHLVEAHGFGGFMIQVVDLKKGEGTEVPMTPAARNNTDLYNRHALGNGQTIEIEMAQDVGIKIFRFFQPLPGPLPYSRYVDQLVSQIQEWHNHGGRNMESCNVLPSDEDEALATKIPVVRCSVE